jgi:hypothetical protein
MASGSQICRPIWADFPRAPQNNKKAIIVNLSTSKDKKLNVSFIELGSMQKQQDSQHF